MLIVSDATEYSTLISSLGQKGWLVDSLHAKTQDQNVTLLTVQQELRRPHHLRIIHGTYDHISSTGRTKVAILGYK